MIKLKSLLNESSPGFENRQVGDPLPTLDSIQAAYQAKQGLQEAESFTATSKDSGKTTVFKSKSNRDAAIKAGTHEKAAKGGDSPPAGNDTSKADKPNMFSKDTGYDAGGEAKEEPLNVTDDFIDSLKSQYKNVSKQTPEQEKELETTLDKLDKKQLKKLAFSDINVVSDIASKKWYNLSYPSDDEPKKDKSEPSTSDSIDNAYDAKDFKSTVKSLKGKVSDEDYNEIKDNLKALANLQYDLEDIDRDEDNEEWGMQKDTIDAEVDDLKGIITKAIDNQVDKNGVPLKAIDKDLDNSFDDKEKIKAYLNKPTKDSTQQRAGNTEVNKSVRNQAKKLGITPAKLGKEEYQKAMVGAAYEALTDSNFSTEARQLLAVITGDEKLAEKPDYPSMSDEDFDTKIAQIRKDREAGDVYTTPENDKASELGQHSSSESSWSGADAIDAIAFDLKMNGYKDLAAKIQSVIKED